MSIGFSTGALAKGDVRRGLEMQRGYAQGAVELSALREPELVTLVDLIPELDMTRYAHVSVHAPSRLRDLDQITVCELLSRVPKAWPIIVHPDVITEPEPWRSLGSRVCVENMDGRKSRGQTCGDLERVWVQLPESRFCLDVAHAAQIDPSMDEARSMLRKFANRLAQLHVSRLGDRYEHLQLDGEMKDRIGEIRDLVPSEVPLIIESVTTEIEEVPREIERVREAFGR